MKKTIRAVLCVVLASLMVFTISGCKKPVIIPTVTQVTVSKATSALIVGESSDITATVTMSDNSINSNVIWSSSDEAIASVKSGKITALKIGSAIITATSIADSSKKADCTVSVTVEPKAEISQSEISLLVGSRKTLTATITLADGSTSTDVTWSSSNTSVATVDGGTVNAIKSGTAIITVISVTDSSIKATCTVTATYEPAIEIDKTTATLTVGKDTLTLTATVRLANGTINNLVTWSSSDTKVATVSAGGVVTVLNFGEATITATSNSIESLKATCVITSLVEPTITLNKNAAIMVVGGTSDLSAEVILSDGSKINDVSWTTSDALVATVSDSGVVTGIKLGDATITATFTFTNDTLPLVATCAVSVVNSGIVLSKTKVDLFQGDSETITAEVLLPSGDTNSNVSWSSANTSVVTVDGGGLTAVAPGTSTITITSLDDSSITTTCTVNVHIPTSVILSRPEALMLIGSGELRLSATALYQNNIISDKVIWISSDDGIATVDDGGILMPISPGTVTITAKVPNGSSFITATCLVDVKADATGIETITENGIILTLTNINDNDILCYSVKAQNKTITSAIIPSYKNRAAVAQIEDDAFRGCNELNSLTLGANIVEIGSYAFYQTDKLIQNLTLNENTRMADYAFSRAQFRKVTISEGTTVIPLAAFQAAGIREVVFPRSLKEIKSYAFADCRWLVTADLTNTSLEMIGTEMVGTKLGNSFYECNALTSVGRLPDTLKEIGFATFLKCNNLTTISLGNDVRKIGGQAFFQCAKIRTLTIPASVRNIGEGAFNSWGSDQAVIVAFANEASKPLGFHANWRGEASNVSVTYSV